MAEWRIDGLIARAKKDALAVTMKPTSIGFSSGGDSLNKERI